MDFELITRIIGIGLLVMYLAAIVSALEAILKARTSQGAIAWTISLLTFPIAALPLYLIFGRNRFDGYLDKRDEIERESLRLIQRTSDNIQDHLVPVSADSPIYMSLFNLARMPATRGNTLQLLVDGHATFDDISRGMQSAQRYILFQFYI